jgi:hypothetical protein
VAISNELSPFLYCVPPVVGIRCYLIPQSPYYGHHKPPDRNVSKECAWCKSSSYRDLTRIHISKSWINGVRDFNAQTYTGVQRGLSTQGNSMVTPLVCTACSVDILAIVAHAPLFFVHDDTVIIEQLTPRYLLKDVALLVLSYYRLPRGGSDSD